MSDIKKIHTFAVKWFEKFRDPDINHQEITEHYMGDECAALGFEMDCGNAFAEKYGDASHDHEALDRIIEEITDIPLLGSAIFSQWRYFNHWAMGGEDILRFENRAWFLTALGRLIVLTGDNPHVFSGFPQKIRIVSNNICYGPAPQPDDEVEQHLTINSSGGVWFSAYNYGTNGLKYSMSRAKNFHIDKSAAATILNAVAEYFSGEYDVDYVTDIGGWEMDITNTEGSVYKMKGSLCGRFDVDGTDLSDLIRRTLDMDDLLVFDGRARSDIIERVTLDYTHAIIVNNQLADGGCEHQKLSFSEKLVIDRRSGALEYIRKMGAGITTQKMFIPDGIANLLDDIDENELFGDIPGEPEDIIDTPDDTSEYTLTVDFKSGVQQVMKGTYDKYGLPEDWGGFVKAINNFMYEYNFTDIFAPSVYNAARRRRSDIIYCSVEFDEGYNSYYYITEDDSIKVGDRVIVPAGKNNHESVVEVVKVEYFQPENVPLPLEKTKHIIRKCTQDEENIE